MIDSHLLQELRVHTRALHAKLDTNAALMELMGPSPTLKSYEHVLERFLGFFAPLEAAMFESKNWPVDPAWHPYTNKTEAIRKDLSYLGVEWNDSSYAQEHFKPRSVAEAWGVAYVLAGSSLGGVVVATHVKKALQLTPSGGCDYFYGAGPDTFRVWKQFCVALRDWHIENRDKTQEAVTAAVAVFQDLDLWLATGVYKRTGFDLDQ